MRRERDQLGAVLHHPRHGRVQRVLAADPDALALVVAGVGVDLERERVSELRPVPDHVPEHGPVLDLDPPIAGLEVRHSFLSGVEDIELSTVEVRLRGDHVRGGTREDERSDVPPPTRLHGSADHDHRVDRSDEPAQRLEPGVVWDEPVLGAEPIDAVARQRELGEHDETGAGVQRLLRQEERALDVPVHIEKIRDELHCRSLERALRDHADTTNRRK